MTSPRYHHGNLPTALVQAGLTTAKSGGPAALQLRELAAAVGVSPSAVYRHFPDMAHLSAEVSRGARETLAVRMLDAAAAVPAVDGDPAESAIRRMQAIGRAYIQFAVDEPQLFDTAFMDAGAPPACADAPSAWGVLNDALDALVQVGALSGDRRANAPLVAWSAVHGLSGVLVRRMLPSPHQPGDAITATLAGVLDALGVRQPTG